MKTSYLTLADLWSVLKKKWIAVVLCAVLLFAVGFGAGLALPAKYSATFSCQARYMQGEEFVKVNGLTTSQLSSVQTLCKEYATMVNTHDALYERVAGKLHVGFTVAELKAMVDATSDSTQLVVTVTHTDPAAVEAVAAALEGEVVSYINDVIWPNISMEALVPGASATATQRSSLHPIAMGVILGLAGALACYLFFLGRRVFGNALRDEEEIVRALPALPLLGTLRGAPNGGEDAWLKPEGIHALRTNVTVRLKGAQCPVVGVVGVDTSAHAADALAVAFSGAEKRVLILDLNETVGKRAEALAGLFDYLEGREASLDALLHPTETAGVMRLFGGNATAPQDLLATDRFHALLQSFKEASDVILVSFDSAETAAVLSPAITGYLLDVCACRTDARGLCRAHATLQNAEGNLLGMAAWLMPRTGATK